MLYENFFRNTFPPSTSLPSMAESKPSPLKVLSSLSDFDAWVLTSSENLHVLLCGTTWDEASQPGGAMDSLLLALLEATPGIHIARVDCEEVGDLSEQFSLAMVPTFLLFRGKALVERVEGPSAGEVTRKVEALSRPSAAGGASPAGAPAALPPSLLALRARVERLVTAAPVMAFIKGTPAAPKCKFTRRLLEIFTEAGTPFGTFDVLSDEAVRQGVKDFSEWPTFPQVFVGGKLVGGVDIVQELKDSGEYATTFPAAPAAETAAAGGGSGAEQQQQQQQQQATPEQAAQGRLLRLAQSAPVVLLMKGTPAAPACGFSERAVGYLTAGGLPFKAFDVLTDSGLREAAKAMYSWPTFPMLLVQGSLAGGVDVLREMSEAAPGAGSLAQQLGVPAAAGEGLQERMSRLVGSARTVLFMKGEFSAPRCGFSAQAVKLLTEAGVEVGGVKKASSAPVGGAGGLYPLGDLAEFDILEDQEVREGLKAREAWPTFPMLFHNNK